MLGVLRGSLPWEKFLDVCVDLIFADMGIWGGPPAESESGGD